MVDISESTNQRPGFQNTYASKTLASHDSIQSKYLYNILGYSHSSSTTAASLLQPHLRAAVVGTTGVGNSLERSRQIASSGIGGGERGSRDRSSDSNDHNSDDEAGGGGLSGAEDEDGGHPADQTGQSAGKKKKKKKHAFKNRTSSSPLILAVFLGEI